MTKLSSVLLSLLPGLLLVLFSLFVFAAFLEALLTDEAVQGQMLVLLLLLAIAWWAYTQLPSPIRHGIQRLVRRRRGDGRH